MVAVVAAVLCAATLGATAACTRSSPRSSSRQGSGPPVATSPPASTATAPSASTRPAASPPSSTPVTTPSSTPVTTAPSGTGSAALLGPGDRGPAVLALQQRLSALGYWLGTPDGTFGDSTEQAVFALQKAAGLARDGVVGPATEGALTEGVVPRPRPAAGRVIEVDLSRDLLLVVTDGRLDEVLNTSTGGGYLYQSAGVTAVADTPTGHFTIERQVDGLVVDSLGALWRPKYFDGGFAIHGDSSVPPYPVSHGCVRVSDEAIDWIWADDIAPLGTPVWVY